MDAKRVQQILKDDELDALTWAAFKGLKVLDGSADSGKAQGWYVVGFDSEFNTERELLISYQLWGEDGVGRILSGPQRRSLHDIAKEASILGGKRDKILIASFFNTAELSQLNDPFWQTENLNFYQVHPNGIFHVKGFCEMDGKTVEFFYFDLWHFFASMREGSSLYSVAERFGFKKLEYDVTNLSLADLDIDNFRAYALNDAKLCVQVFKVLEETYQRVNNVSIIARDTPAAAAMASFRKNYLVTDVQRPSLYVRQLSLSADWAGRVECGYIGEIYGIHEFDADSLYPRAALLLGFLPSPKQWQIGIPSDMDLTGIEGFIDVQFAFPTYEEWPCLPVFKESALYFPLSGRTICTIGELRAALSRGVRLQKIYRCCYYRNGEHGEFTRFLNDNLRLKADAGDNEALRAVAKLNMNASIGKFIQNKGGVDYEAINEYIRANISSLQYSDINRLFGGSLVIQGQSFNRPVKIGSGFYPEWHSLILGKSREVMAYAIYNSLAYPKILMISTDSLHIPTSDLGPTMVKFKHEFGPVYFKSIRCRVHIAKDGDKIIKLAQHGMPMSREVAANMIIESDHTENIAVNFIGHKTLREAARTNTRLFSDKERTLRINLRPDSKRLIAADGYTHPIKVVA